MTANKRAYKRAFFMGANRFVAEARQPLVRTSVRVFIISSVSFSNRRFFPFFQKIIFVPTAHLTVTCNEIVPQPLFQVKKWYFPKTLKYDSMTYLFNINPPPRSHRVRKGWIELLKILTFIVQIHLKIKKQIHLAGLSDISSWIPPQRRCLLLIPILLAKSLESRIETGKVLA